MKLDILIIDDKEQKIENLRNVIASISNDINIEDAQTVVGAREKMREYSFDLVILDMVIPELVGDEPSRSGGLDYLTEIYENPEIKRPLQIIGLTEYEEEFNQQKEDFRDRLWYLLFYSQKDLRWKKSLKDKVIQLMGMKRDFIQTLFERDKYDVGIICALSEEFEQMQLAFDGCEWEDCRISGLPFLFRTTTVPTSNMHDVKVIAVCADCPGVCATASLATAMYTVAKVDSLFMTGITAGVDDGTIKLNDVIIANAVGDYATGKLKDNEEGDISWLREIHEASASARLLSAASLVAKDDGICSHIINEMLQKHLITRDTKVQFRIAKTVCGPFVLGSGNIVDALKESDRKLQAIDMEGFGLYLTAHLLEKQALWIKAVCDFADRNKGDSYHKSCSYASAAFLYQVLRVKF